MTQNEKVRICLLHQLVLVGKKMNRQEACYTTPKHMLTLFHFEKNWEHSQQSSFQMTWLEKQGFVTQQDKDVEITSGGYQFYAQWAATHLENQI